MGSVVAIGMGTALATHEAADQPNDPLYPETDDPFRLGQWGLRQVNVEQAWHNSTGSGAVIAVVDTGVALEHPDVGANLLPGNTFVECGSGGCGNGSWRDSPNPQGHGTHVAGIAAALTDNAIGVSGVAPDARVIPINVFGIDEFGDASATTEDVAFGVRWAVEHGADVVNLSLGQLPGVGQALHVIGAQEELDEALAHAHAQGVLVVAAAGNEIFPLCDEPAFSDGVLCVAATDSFELPADYSNLPNKPDQLVVRAPGGSTADFLTVCGGGVVSTVPAGEGDDFDAECYGEASENPNEPEYADLIGTSMATPHVSGVAALLAAQGCDRQQMLDLITSTARHPLTGFRGRFSPDYGFGIVDAEAATAAAAAPVDEGGCRSPGAIVGTVIDADTEAPLEGVLVTIDTGQSALTDDQGDYTLPNVPAGDRTVTASRQGYVTQTRTTTVAAGTAAVVDFALAPAAVGTGTIAGRVTDADTGAKLHGVLVVTDTGQSATTNKGGRYRIANVAAGDRTVTASREGYDTQTQSATVAKRRTVADFALVPSDP